MPDNSLISRVDLLAGRARFDRRPARVLAAIEARCSHMLRESRRAIEAYFLRADGEFQRQFDVDYFQAFKQRAGLAEGPALADLRHYARYWQGLLPPDPALRAAVAHLMIARYEINSGLGLELWGALGLSDPEIRAAYRLSYGHLPPPEPAETAAGPVAGSLAAGDLNDENTLREVEGALEWMNLAGGAPLYRAGEAGDALYILISGHLRLFMSQGDDSDVLVAERSRGDLVGEIEVLTGEPRGASVYAARDSELVKLPRAALERLAEKYPRVMLRVNRLLATRLRSQLAGPERAANNLVTFAVLPASEAIQLSDFCQRLSSALSDYGPVLHLDRRRLDEALGPGAADTRQDDMDNSRVAGWLSEQDVKYRWVLYEADAGPSAWTERCVRQADRILVVADATVDPEPGAAERRIMETGSQERIELVLLHPDEAVRPSGTRRWLQARRVLRHHHLHATSQGDLERLARHLTGNAVGLVLGGGGARGWAHVGAWRALRESGLPVDLLGGTSMGAMIGSLFAMGLTDREIRQVAGQYSSMRKWVDPTLPAVSLLAGDKWVRILQQEYGDWQIEDLWQPFFCVASDLTNASQKIFTQGPLWLAVRASTAIPGIFSPVLYEGRVLVDGGVLNNLPVDIMRTESEGGTIVAVNVFPDVDLVHNYDFGPSISGFRALLSWLNPLAESMPAPSIFEYLVRVVALNNVKEAKVKRDQVDIYIQPSVERFNVLDFGAYRQIMDIGYRAACDEIALWHQSHAGTPSSPPIARPFESLEQALSDLAHVLDAR